MSDWTDFFKRFLPQPDVPNVVMVRFVNRYIQPMDDIKYKIVFEGQELQGTTTVENHSVEVHVKTTQPIKVYAWSRLQKNFKLIDTITPKIGEPLMVYEHMKTVKHKGKTERHPQNSPAKPPTPPKKPLPKKPAPGPSPTTDQGAKPNAKKNADAEPIHEPERPVSDKITELQLKAIFPVATKEHLQEVADELNTDLKKYKLDTVLRRAHFFAQVHQEASATLAAKEENLNYKPDVLISKFGYYGKNPKEAKEDGRIDNPKSPKKPLQLAKPEVIANKAYGNRGKNGNIESGDGWRYRGRGIFQLTLKENYEAFENEYKTYWGDSSPNFLKNPEKVKEFPYYIRSAVWYWLHNKIYEKADEGATDKAVNAVTRVVNGAHMDAAKERRDAFNNLSYGAFK
ncbi:glycoside hydrolase family 19 protein [Glaciimonas soli]|uniref:Chitinase n=1 Tax=Glaciimonas soli TaxID=2590999 RepID=A0A843YQ59_9BURK|nr:hypothetical protein [Glaciimonas soli]MQR01655.1 hypothetical protein [Glaciimonas soli]